MSTADFADVLSTINGQILPSPPSMAPDLLFRSFGFGFSKPDLKLLESFPPLAPLHRVPGLLRFFLSRRPASLRFQSVDLLGAACFFCCFNFTSVIAYPCSSG
jgi:hypothetical protein